MFLGLLIGWAGQARAEANTASRPDIGVGNGSKLILLARVAMREYLTHRTSANIQVIPNDLQNAWGRVKGKKTPLADLPYPVSLSLRLRGGVVATSTQQGRGLVRNVIAAALGAMRSPRLPDRVTAGLLDSLTIELEVLGVGKPIAMTDIAKTLRPGLDGVRLSLGVRDPALRGAFLSQAYQEAMLLPGSSYVLGLDAAKMHQHCLSQLRVTAESKSLPRRWRSFGTLHYVGYPARAEAWQLYRGKILLPDAMIGKKQFAEAAESIAAYLIRRQNKQGLYDVPGSSRIADHLYAAYAMVRLGKIRKNAVYRASAEAALGYVAEKFVKMDDKNARAHVVTPRPEDEVLATAFFLLTTQELPKSEKSSEIQHMMLRDLSERIDKEGQFLGANGKPVNLLSAAVALMGLNRRIDYGASGGPDPELDRAMENLFRRAGRYDSGVSEAARKVSTEELAWIARGISFSGGGKERKGPGMGLTYLHQQALILRDLVKRQVLHGAALDETGGYRDREGRMSTAAAGAAAYVFSMGIAAGLEDERPEKLSASLEPARDAARRFCYRMVYRPNEAYFVATSADWVGAVRHQPNGAGVSLKACAAALEALSTAD